MKAIYIHLSGALALTLTIAACVPAAAPPPPPASTTPTPSPAPTPTPTSAPVIEQPEYENYLNAPQTPGDWTYVNSGSGGYANFGTSPANTRFTIWCDRPQRRVDLIRPESFTGTRTMRIVTETTTRILEANPSSSRGNQIVASLSANDPLLDAMAITRGHFGIETEGLPTLYLPAWPEISRVIEDCR